MTIAHTTMSLIFHGLKIPLFKVYLRQSTALYLSLSGSLSKERDCTISGANQPRIALIINAWINKRYNSLLLCSMANYSMVMLKLESLRPCRSHFWHFDQCMTDQRATLYSKTWQSLEIFQMIHLDLKMNCALTKSYLDNLEADISTFYQTKLLKN